jgi:hypothetical protein
MEAHLGAIALPLEKLWRFTLELWRLTLEPWRNMF